MNTKSIRKSPILDALFTSRARIKVLELFFLRSSKRHYLREIAEITNLPVRGVQRELARLEDAGILESEREGNRKYFMPKRDSPVFFELRSILVKTVGFADVVQAQLEKKADLIHFAFIFGSFAEGTEGVESDIDLLIVGSISSRRLAGLLQNAKQALEREINPVIMNMEEFVEKIVDQDSFILSVLQGPKIFLVGAENELSTVAS